MAVNEGFNYIYRGAWSSEALLVHPMLPIEFHKLPELIASESDIVSKETHESNLNKAQLLEMRTRVLSDYAAREESPTGRPQED